MERVTEADLPEVEAYLGAQPERAMFPLNNLRAFGLDGDHPYAPCMWLSRKAGVVEGVLTVSRNRTIMPNCPPDMALSVLEGQSVWRVIGPADVTRPLIERLGLATHQPQLDQDEPHYALRLDMLEVPDGDGRLLALKRADLEEMLRWRRDYGLETFGMSPEVAEKEVWEDVQSYIDRDTHRVLVTEGKALSMTGFNARLPEIVQVGGVYTPPALRGRGHARRAVALHLAEVRAEGVARATLFAANRAAQRAYEAIGFQRIGDWTLFLLEAPVDV